MTVESETGRDGGQRTVGGIVLAAGRSVRMGEPKALLDLDGRSFLAAAVDALQAGGCDETVVVAGDPAVEEAARELPSPGPTVPGRAVPGRPVPARPVRVAMGAPDSEQLDSLLAGLGALSDSVVAAVVLPVDHPLVRPETVRALIDAARRDPEAVIRPTTGGAPGHPTLFPREIWERLRDPTLPLGARSVVQSASTRTVDVPVSDPGILADIDTPAAYRRHVPDRGRSGKRSVR
jgi:molybdenum cofactor cytidylyltransferase